MTNPGEVPAERSYERLVNNPLGARLGRMHAEYKDGNDEAEASTPGIRNSTNWRERKAFEVALALLINQILSFATDTMNVVMTDRQFSSICAVLAEAVPAIPLPTMEIKDEMYKIHHGQILTLVANLKVLLTPSSPVAGHDEPVQDRRERTGVAATEVVEG